MASSTPAMAGPMKRALCSSRLLIATALSRCSRGTVVASMAWKAGKASVPRLPPSTASTPISTTVSDPVASSTASSTDTAMLAVWSASTSRRGSKRSVSGPAGSPSTRLGIVLKKPITPSAATEPPSSSATYPNAAHSTQLPTWLISTPAANRRKRLSRNAARVTRAPPRRPGAAAVPFALAGRSRPRNSSTPPRTAYASNPRSRRK